MALTEVYVDPSIDADSGTGSPGDPYGDLRYAFTQETIGTNGTRINVESSAAEVITTALDGAGFTLVSTDTQPIVIQGFTSTAEDGGRATIDCATNSIQLWTDSAADNISFIDLDISGGGSGYLIDIDNDIEIRRCSFILSSGHGLNVDSGLILNCEIVINYNGNGIFAGIGTSNVSWVGNLIRCTNLLSTGYCNGIATIGGFEYNIIDWSEAGTANPSFLAANVREINSRCSHNTLIGPGAGNGVFAAAGTTDILLIANNLILNFDTGINNQTDGSEYGLQYLHNAFYNCTTNIDETNDVIGHNYEVGTVNLSQNPFPNLPGNYTMPAGVVKELSAGYPSTFLNSGANYPLIGALQPNRISELLVRPKRVM